MKDDFDWKTKFYGDTPDDDYTTDKKIKHFLVGFLGPTIITLLPFFIFNKNSGVFFMGSLLIYALGLYVSILLNKHKNYRFIRMGLMFFLLLPAILILMLFGICSLRIFV